MTAQIKLKVQRKAVVKMKVLPIFPANVVAEPGINIDRTGQTYTFSLDLPAVGVVVGPALSTDNAIARFDGATGQLLQNSTVTISDAGIVVQNANGATLPAADTGTVLRIAGPNAALTRVEVNAFGNAAGASFTGRSAKGTGAAPTASQTNDVLASFFGKGYGATAYGDNAGGGIVVQAAENHTDTAQGSYISFFTTIAGAAITASRGLIDNVGAILWPGTVTGGSKGAGTINATGLYQGGVAVPTVASKLSAFAATTSAELAGVISDETGSGALVFATSPALVTPALGVASATSINKVAITAPATGATLTIPDGVTLTGPASSGTAMTLGNAETVTGVKTFGDQTIKLRGSSSGVTTLASLNGGASNFTLFVPAAGDTLVGKATTDTLTNKSISGATNTLSAVPISALAAQAAFTFVVNNTSGSATPTAVDIGSLASKASPAAGDFIVLSDQAASGALKRATVSSVASAGSVASVNGQTGALVIWSAPQGRLTLTTATPVLGTTVSGATTVYYTPYVGNIVPIYDGTNIIPTVFAELSQATTDTTKSPAAVAASSVYDIFVWNDSGTIRATRGPAWTNDTTRSAGTALVRVNGLLLNNASITNGPAASRGTYVGTIRSNASSQIDFIFGASSAGGTAAFFGLWNAYNRVNVATTVTDSTATWTYTSATVRSANNSTGNRISFVSGLAEDGIKATYFDGFATGTSVNSVGNIGIALDATNVFDKRAFGLNPSAGGAAANFTIAAPNSYAPQLGFHFLQAVESSDGTNTTTFDGGVFMGLSAELRM